MQSVLFISSGLGVVPVLLNSLTFHIRASLSGSQFSIDVVDRVGFVHRSSLCGYVRSPYSASSALGCLGGACM